jgi:hypothetical protein
VTYAAVTDVRARYDGDVSDERISAVLDDAETVLLRRVPDLGERADGNAVLLQATAMVEVSMTIRALTAPQADTVQYETAGPFAVTFARDTRGYLRPTVDELALLGGGDRRGKAFTVAPANEPETVPTADLDRWFDWPERDTDISPYGGYW